MPGRWGSAGTSVSAATFAIWDGGGIFAGNASGLTATHAHHAIQLTLASRTGLRLRAHNEREWHTYSAAVVPSHVRHALDVDGVPVWAVVFVDPGTQAGRALSTRFPEEQIADIALEAFGEAPARLFEAYRDGASAQIVAAAQSVVAALVGDTRTAAVPDERIGMALKTMDRRLHGTLRLSDVAREVHLSTGRLRHLLVEQTGAGFRTHLRWRRLMRSWSLVCGGASLTEAAHAAGFSDSAHLSRVVRQTFGLTPSTVSAALHI